METLKEKAKRTLVADDWILYNDTDLIAVAYPESIPEFKSESEYKNFIQSMIIFPGEKSEFKIDGGSIPANGDVDNPNNWTYVGVTDGNSLRFTGNKSTGYKAIPENTTYDNPTFGNRISKLNQIKGPYEGFESMEFWNKPMRGWFPAENQAPADIRQQVYNDANNLASEVNKQLQNSKKTISLNGEKIFNSTNYTGNNMVLRNIIFDNSGNVALSSITDFFTKKTFNINPFKNNLVGCTK